MSKLTDFLKRHRFEVVFFPFFAAELFIWWRLQYNEKYMSKEKRDLPLNPIQWVRDFYEDSSVNKDNKNEKSA